MKTSMNEKEVAYEQFLESQIPILIVFGMRGGGEGKSVALESIMQYKRMNVIVHTMECLPTLFMNNGSNPIEKVIYHLITGEEYFMEALQKRYGSNVQTVYFTN